jgi:hypothetical protein
MTTRKTPPAPPLVVPQADRLKPLLALCADSNQLVREHSSRTIGREKGCLSMKTPKPVLVDGDQKVQQLAAQVLGRLKDRLNDSGLAGGIA